MLKTNLVRFLILSLTVLMLTGCKPEFSIEFDLAPDVNTHCRMTYYASSRKQGLMMEPMADIVAGKGKVTAPTKYPTIVYLFQGSSTQPAAMFYAERGDKIVITGKGTNPADWEISGNRLTEEWSKWRLENKRALTAGGKELNQAIAGYVKDHPDSKLSAVLLILQYSRHDDEEGFIRLFKSLKSGATSDKELMAALSVADMPDGTLLPGGNLSTMILSGPSGDADTLRFANGKASLVVFRDSKNRENLNAENDSLRALLRAFPDSTSRMIAKISFDPDSTTWINSVEADSLRNIARGWMPFGVADSTAMVLGVRRTPFYIVADGKGKRLYGGSDLSKAMGEFRKISR